MGRGWSHAPTIHPTPGEGLRCRSGRWSGAPPTRAPRSAAYDARTEREGWRHGMSEPETGTGGRDTRARRAARPTHAGRDRRCGPLQRLPQAGEPVSADRAAAPRTGRTDPRVVAHAPARPRRQGPARGRPTAVPGRRRDRRRGDTARPPRPRARRARARDRAVAVRADRPLPRAQRHARGAARRLRSRRAALPRSATSTEADAPATSRTSATSSASRRRSTSFTSPARASSRRTCRFRSATTRPAPRT